MADDAAQVVDALLLDFQIDYHLLADEYLCDFAHACKAQQMGGWVTCAVPSFADPRADVDLLTAFSDLNVPSLNHHYEGRHDETLVVTFDSESLYERFAL